MSALSGRGNGFLSCCRPARLAGPAEGLIVGQVGSGVVGILVEIRAGEVVLAGALDSARRVEQGSGAPCNALCRRQRQRRRSQDLWAVRTRVVVVEARGVAAPGRRAHPCKLTHDLSSNGASESTSLQLKQYPGCTFEVELYARRYVGVAHCEEKATKCNGKRQGQGQDNELGPTHSESTRARTNRIALGSTCCNCCCVQTRGRNPKVLVYFLIV